MSFFDTSFKNDRKTVVRVVDRTGTPLIDLFPGTSQTISSDEPESLYARWSSVIFREDGKVDLVARAGFVEKKHAYTIYCLNSAGADVERRVIGGQPVILPKGVPVVVPVELTHPDVVFGRWEIQTVQYPRKHPNYYGFVFREAKIEDVRTPRSDRELRAIEKALEK